MNTWRALFSVPSVVFCIATGCGGTTASVQGGDDGGGASDAPGVNDGPEPPSEGGSCGSIACGQATTCDACTQECCVTIGGGGAGDQCIAKGGSCQGVALSCSSAASCPSGDVCCAALQGRLRDGGTLATSCDAKCGQGEVQLCTSTSECPSGEDCRRAFGGFRVCVPPFDGGVPRFDGGGPPPPLDASPPPDAALPDSGGTD